MGVTMRDLEWNEFSVEPMNPEFTNRVRFYFRPDIAKQIGRRDKWRCQGGGCAKSFQQGYLVDAAHYPQLHQKQVDTNPDHGRILCLGDHLLEHLDLLNFDPTWSNIRAVELASQRIFAKGLHTYWMYEQQPQLLDMDRQWLFQTFEARSIEPREFILCLQTNSTEIV